jgi:hypothetical protein
LLGNKTAMAMDSFMLYSTLHVSWEADKTGHNKMGKENEFYIMVIQVSKVLPDHNTGRTVSCVKLA